VRHALAVVAHPDDESFGLGAVLSGLAEAGTQVDLVCFSRGEASTVGADEDLASVRSAELVEAAAALGVAHAWLADLPDGHLAEHVEEMTAEVLARAGGVELLVVLEPGGVTGHPDHRAATAAAFAAADRLGVSCLGWGVSTTVAQTLAEELGAPLRGIDGPGVECWRVDRTRQRAAIACHRSQDPGNPLLARRLCLQADIEYVQWRRPLATRGGEPGVGGRRAGFASRGGRRPIGSSDSVLVSQRESGLER